MIRINPKSGGWLEVVCGPMFSGKSEEMIRRLRRAEIAGQRSVIFKPRIDDRYDVSDVVSHAGIRMRAVPVPGVSELAELARGFEVVGIDEAQFFDEEIVGVALELADDGGLEELHLVDPDDLRGAGAGHELGTAVDRDGRHPDTRMADDVSRVVAVVDPRLEEDHALARDLGAAKPADHLLALAGEHRPADDFEPASSLRRHADHGARS